MNAKEMCKKVWKEVERWADRVPPLVLVGVGAWGAYMSCLALGLSDEEIARLIPKRVREAILALDP
jgi:hypothetical protein